MLQPEWCLSPLVLRFIDHTHTRTLWMCDQLVAEAASYTTHNKHKRHASMPSARFETATPANQSTADVRQTACPPGSVFMFITSLFMDASSSSDSTASNERTDREYFAFKCFLLIWTPSNFISTEKICSVFVLPSQDPPQFSPFLTLLQMTVLQLSLILALSLDTDCDVIQFLQTKG